MGSGHAKNEKDCGVTSLEPVGRDKNSGFLWTGAVRTKETQGNIDTAIKREVTSALELSAETTFLLVPLPDHKRKKRKK